MLAYSDEVYICGFWPGGADEGAFYAYAYPEPAGFPEWPVAPAGAAYAPNFGEFLLPYRTVRTASNPEAVLLDFMESTYVAAATLPDWNRDTLEAGPPTGDPVS